MIKRIKDTLSRRISIIEDLKKELKNNNIQNLI